jgi:hypothetical protein
MSSTPSSPHAKLPLEQLSAAFEEIGVSVPPATLASWAVSGIPTDPGTRLPRKKLAEHLTAIGFPVTRASLNCFANRGGGPPYCLWGNVAICEWGDGLKWAQEKITAKRVTTAEGRELDRAARAEKSAATAEPVNEPVE